MRKLSAVVVLAVACASCGGGGAKGTRAGSQIAPGVSEAPGTSAVPSDATGTSGSSSSGRASGGASGGPAAGGSGTTAAQGKAGPPVAAAGAGVRTGTTKTSVLFGMHLPQSGAVGALVGRSWHGADAYLKYINDTQKGVYGRKLSIAVSDDAYDAAQAAKAIRQLVDSDKVFAASCLAGVDQCVVGATYANSKGVPYLHAGMAEAAVRAKPWTFPTSTTYPYGVERMIDYLVTKRHFSNRKWGAFYLNSEQLTKDMLPRAVKTLNKYHLKFLDSEPAEKDQSDFSAAITKLKNAGVNTLWFHVDPTLIAKFTAQAQSLQFRPTYVFTSPAGGDLYATAAGGGLDGAIGVTSIADANWSGAASFAKIFHKYYPNEDPDEFNIIAYVAAMVFVEGLRKAGPDLGRDAFARGLGSVSSFNTGISSPISYTKRGRVQAANSTVAIEEIHGTGTDQKTGFSF